MAETLTPASSATSPMRSVASVISISNLRLDLNPGSGSTVAPDPLKSEGIDMPDDTPVACSLGGDELARRLATFAAGGADGLISSRAAGSRPPLHCPTTKTLRPRLQ